MEKTKLKLQQKKTEIDMTQSINKMNKLDGKIQEKER